MKICVMNASNPKNVQVEHDEYIDLRDRKSCFKDGKIVKQCRSFHSWAYSLESEFFVYQKAQWPKVFTYDAIIVLVNRDIQELIPFVKKLKGMNKKVAVCYHEGIQDLLHDHSKWKPLQDIVNEAGLYINFIGHYKEFYEGLFQKAKIANVNHTNPFDWEPSFKKSWEDRTKDILVGTRTFNQRLSRNTLVSLATLSDWQRRNPSRSIEFMCEDQGDVQGLLNQLGLDNIKFHKGPLEYTEWLKFMSDFRYVVHHDLSMNLGQISLDALFVDALPVGGTTWINMMLGTDDAGSVNNILEIVENYSIDGTDLIRTKQSLHPNQIKEDIEDMFNEKI